MKSKFVLTLSVLTTALILTTTVGASAPPALTEADRQQVAQVNNIFRMAVRRVLPAVVLIEVVKTGDDGPDAEGAGLGSGCIIDPAGYIVTNHHVVADVDKVQVVLNDGRFYVAQEIYLDEDTDLAVVKIDPAGESLPYAEFGNSDDAMVGDFVMAMGAPFGSSLKQTVTLGIVSFKGRQNNILGRWGLEDFIQTDAEINRGNSGGPLVNLYGEIVGINSNIFSLTGLSAGYGFSIPSNMVQDVAGQLIEQGEVRRGWLGISMQGLSEMRDYVRQVRTFHPDAQNERITEMEEILARYDDSAQGVVVREVLEGGPAERDGLKSEDLILSVDGRPVKEGKDLQQIIAYKRPDQTATCRVIRKEKEMEIVVQLGSRKIAKAKQEENDRQLREERAARIARDRERMEEERQQGLSDRITGSDEKPKLGLVVQDLTPQTIDEHSLDESMVVDGGVLIAEVMPGSLAGRFGLKAGEVIVAAEGVNVASKEELVRIVRAVDLTKDGLMLRVRNLEGIYTTKIRTESE